MRPIAAEQASEEPDTAAKPAEPKIEAMASPPGSAEVHTRAAWNIPLVRSVWKLTKPRNRNIGIELSTQLAENS
mgnify:CR=1 FL=1